MHSTVLHIGKKDPSAMLRIATIHCSHQQHNSLSMHINMHYTPSTTHHTAFHNPPQHTTNKHKAYLCKWQQNGTRCRDGVKVLWCHSHLYSLVGFEGSIPTCTCFPEGKLFLWLVLMLSLRLLLSGFELSKMLPSALFTKISHPGTRYQWE